MPHFPYFQNQIEKWGISRFLNIKKWGHFEENHVIDFKTRKRPKMNMFDFGTFQEKIAYALTRGIPPSKAFWGISRYFRTVNTGLEHLIIKLSKTVFSVIDRD